VKEKVSDIALIRWGGKKAIILILCLL